MWRLPESKDRTFGFPNHTGQKPLPFYVSRQFCVLCGCWCGPQWHNHNCPAGDHWAAFSSWRRVWKSHIRSLNLRPGLETQAADDCTEAEAVSFRWLAVCIDSILASSVSCWTACAVKKGHELLMVWNMVLHRDWQLSPACTLGGRLLSAWALGFTAQLEGPTQPIDAARI